MKKQLFISTLLVFFALASVTLTSCKKEGCIDETANNYDADAKTDDGSCTYNEGCTDADAENYDADAVVDDGTCNFLGCTDPEATNYDDKATEDDGTCEYPIVNPCGTGVEFCMTYGGTVKSGDAEVFEYTSSHYRVYWTAGSGSSYEQVELDIYGSTTGTYTINTTGNSGTAGFQYFSNSAGTQNGVSGELEITEFDFGGNGLTGTFSATTEDDTEVESGGFNDAI